MLRWEKIPALLDVIPDPDPAKNGIVTPLGSITDFRFDDIGKTQDTKKMDPTFKKRHETASEVVIHLLLAAANGDVTAIQR